MAVKEYFEDLFNYFGFIPNYWSIDNKKVYTRDEIAKIIGVKFRNTLTNRTFECFDDCWEDMVSNFPCDTHLQMGWEYVKEN